MREVHEIIYKTIIATDPALSPAIPPGARLLCAKTEPKDCDYVAIIRQSGATELLRQFVIQQDGAILLKAINREAKSYLTKSEELPRAGELYVVIRIEYDTPAATRVPIPEPEEKKEDYIPLVNTVQDDSELLTFEEAQELLKVRRTRMYALLQSGELEASKLGKLWRIRRSAINRYLSAKAYKKT